MAPRLQVLWALLFLGSTVAVSAATDGEDWKVRGAGGDHRTQRVKRSKSQSGEGGSKSQKSGGGTGKSKSNSDDHGTDDTTAGTFPKYHTATQDPIPGQYIVTYKETDEIVADSEMDDMSEKLCSSKNGKLMGTYHQVLKGFSAKLTKEAAMEISQMDMIEAVEEDSMVRTNAVGSWGLDRIDQEDLPLDMTYNPIIDGSPADKRGQGVTAYIIDTGIKSDHNEWSGRYAGGMNFVSDDPDGRNSEDCDGHGTHVAGTVGGTTYGVANKVELYAIRVLDCSGSGSFADVISALDWIADNAKKPAVANLSLGGGFVQSVNSAVNRLVDSGVVVTASAGNSDDDSCGQSPAAADKAITVGSTTRNDARFSFSSYGGCVDIFAPGSGITSAWIGNNMDATATISGTSMSSPHVAGLAALYLGENANLSPEELIRKMLQYDATHGEVSGIPDAVSGIAAVRTANLLAYAGPNDCAMEADGTLCTLPNLCDGICQGNVCSLPAGKFSVAIKVDKWSEDTSWELRQGGTVLASENDYTSDPGPLFCNQVDIVQGTLYTFVMMDSFDDGLCCGNGHGNYSIYDGNTHLKTGSNFGSSEATEFTAQSGGNTPPPSPMPTPLPTTMPTSPPTPLPTTMPTSPPTPMPSPVPTLISSGGGPTLLPTGAPTAAPTAAPTEAPTEAPPPPSACSDSSLRLKVLKDGNKITRSCAWVARTDTAERCNLPGVSAACPVTCESCDTCADPGLRFKFTYNDKKITRSCEFVGRVPEKVSDRCAASQNICRLTCGTCSA